MSVGFALAGTGVPTGVKTPVLGLIEKTEMSPPEGLLPKLLVTSKYWPKGSMTAPYGPLPACVGAPVSVKVPSLPTLKIEMVSARELAVYRNFFDGSNANPLGESPSVCGVCDPRAMAPVAPLICNRSTEPCAGRVT